MNIEELERFGPSVGFYDVREQLRRHVYGRSEQAFRDGDSARDAIADIEALEERREFLRSRFIDALGGLPPRDTPLDPRIVETIPANGFRIEKLIFQSRPRTYVTASLYVPDGITEPRGAVLFLCGHHQRAKHEPEYQVVCRYLARAGLVVLAQDPIGQGERFSYFEQSIGTETVCWGVPEHDHAGAQSLILGDSIARYFVHDSMCGVDYLTTRPEVDPNRIGVTGNSGGGTQSCLMMVCDPRLAAAVPGTFIMSRETYMYTGGAQDAEQIWPGMTALGFDHEDVLLMMAPKPVRVVAVTHDFFPIEGTRRTVERCKRLWRMYGSDAIDLVEDQTTHTYTRRLARSAAEFFARHLLGKEVSMADEAIDAIEPSRLWCTRSGQVRGEIEGARIVLDENTDRLGSIETNRYSIRERERIEGALDWLKDRVFANRAPCDANPRIYMDTRQQDLLIRGYVWWSQEGIMNHGLVVNNYQFAGDDLPVTVAVWDGGTNELEPHWRWVRETCRNRRAVMVLDVSGVGKLLPHAMNTGSPTLEFYGALHKLSTDLIWLDDSLPAMRVYDVLRSLDIPALIPGLSTDELRYYAHGRHGTYARLASALDRRVKVAEVVEGLSSYAEWVRSRHYDERDIMSIVLPGILNYCDLPDLEDWMSRRQ